MDGTFLNSKYEVSPEFSEIFYELKKRDILFVPASGRQMPGITKYFETIENEIGFIAENGGYVMYEGKEVFADKLQQSFVGDIIKTVRNINGARAVLSAKKKAYYESDDQEFVNYFTRYYTENEKVDDLTEAVDDEVFKIAIYHPEGSEKYIYPHLKKYEECGLEVVISGEFWVDIMNDDISKGNAVGKLQKLLEISPDQTMVFGDYMNDISMFRTSKYSYAMENAHPQLKKYAKFSAPSNDDFGVTKIISDYLRS